MFTKTLTVLVQAVLLFVFLEQSSAKVEVSQELLHDIVEEILKIVYRTSDFKKESCKDVNPSKLKYYLYTPDNKNSPVYLTEGVNNSSDVFDPSLETKFVTHGWLEDVDDESWLVEMKDAYLKTGNYNVILLDWSKYSRNLYSKSACYVDRIANATARLFHQLTNEVGLDLNKTHLIGHSLGGQLVGLTGQYIQKYAKGKKVGRVTGLDSAGPLFCHPNLDDAGKRISSEDAHFVDGIHTNDNEFGCAISYAHSDFFPNCGERQSGCTHFEITITNLTGSFKTAFGLLSCSHSRVYTYWIESILTNNFESNACDSCTLFSLRRCSTSVENLMGEKTSTSHNGKYYLKTDRSSPYGLRKSSNSLLPVGSNIFKF